MWYVVVHQRNKQYYAAYDKTNKYYYLYPEFLPEDCLFDKYQLLSIYGWLWCDESYQRLEIVRYHAS